MTAEEKLLQRVPRWSEEQAEQALQAAENGAAVDEWGNLAALHEHATTETMRRLAQRMSRQPDTIPGEAREVRWAVHPDWPASTRPATDP
jgi:hypothetical protein